MEQTVVPAAKPIKFPGRIIRSRSNAIPPGSWSRWPAGSSPTRESVDAPRGPPIPRVQYIPRKMSTWRSLPVPITPLTARTKAIAAISASRSRGERSVNAVWSYEAPYAAVTPIKDYLAFYPNRVDAIEERPEA